MYQFPMGKVKIFIFNLNLLSKKIVSIPYGKGKESKYPDRNHVK